MTADSGSRVPVIVLDHRGYAFYHDHDGRRVLPASRYAVRLVTDISMVDQSKASELESVVGIRGHEGRNGEDYVQAARFLHSFGGRAAASLIGRR